MQSVSTNLNLQETRRHGSPDFPLEFNTDDTRDYYKNDINWHWHEEFELVYIIEGCVACHINQSVYELHPALFTKSCAFETGAPQNGQNFVESGISFPHFSQNIFVLLFYLLFITRMIRNRMLFCGSKTTTSSPDHINLHI